MVAFVTNRGDHSFIGLHDIARKETRYVETGIDHDVFPAWSPDGNPSPISASRICITGFRLHGTHSQSLEHPGI